MPILSDKDAANYHRDGFVILRQLFDGAEIGLLRRTALADRELDKHSFSRADGEGGAVRLSVWNHPGNNIYGMYARCRRLVDSAEKLLTGEVYHYHSKMILKDPKVGGAWTWHQDYGYWYHFAVLYPLLTSVSIAVDPSTKTNGCLQVIKGSHLMGRIDHTLSGQQAGADMERVSEALKRLELVYCEMEPGDAIFFDCNLLHRSDQNRSDQPRWSLICCYNAARNDPYKDLQHARYTPIIKVDDSAIKEVGAKRFAEGSDDVSWVSGKSDNTVSGLANAASKRK